MNKWKSIADIRREYGELSIDKSSVELSPFCQFEKWFNDVLKSEAHDPTAFVLSSVDSNGHPDSRVVLLKSIHNQHFIFYTNYESQKGMQLACNPNVSLNFYWPQMARQVRIKGIVEKTSEQESDVYFASRPLKSQVAAKISPQSHPIKSRKILEDTYHKHLDSISSSVIHRPHNWGGYQVNPNEFEFWQGRDNRLHDRIKYTKKNHDWLIACLAP